MASQQVIFYLGPPGTYSHEAASALAASSYELRPSESITSCLSDAKASAAFALLPLENSTYGPVSETINALIGAGEEVRIVREIVRPVRHALLASRDTAERLDSLYATASADGDSQSGSRLRFLNVVYSHEQALGQCSSFLKRECPEAKPTSVASTAFGVQLAQETPAGAKLTAGIGSSHCASVMDVVVLQDGVQDKNNNETRFILLSCSPKAEPEPASDSTKRARALVRITCTTPREGTGKGALQASFDILSSSSATMRKMDRRALPLEVLEGEAEGVERYWPSVYLLELQASSADKLRDTSNAMCKAALENQATEAVVLGVWGIA